MKVVNSIIFSVLGNNKHYKIDTNTFSIKLNNPQISKASGLQISRFFKTIIINSLSSIHRERDGNRKHLVSGQSSKANNQIFD